MASLEGDWSTGRQSKRSKKVNTTFNIGSRIFSTNIKYSAQAFASATFDAGWFSWIWDRGWNRASISSNFSSSDDCWKSILLGVRAKIQRQPLLDIVQFSGPIVYCSQLLIWHDLARFGAGAGFTATLGSSLHVARLLKVNIAKVKAKKRILG